MTVLVPTPSTVVCPHCGTIVPSDIKYCWGCGKPIDVIHERCLICGKPSGHGRHRGSHGLAYYCGCGFVTTGKSEIRVHLEEAR